MLSSFLDAVDRGDQLALLVASALALLTWLAIGCLAGFLVGGAARLGDMLDTPEPHSPQADPRFSDQDERLSHFSERA